MEFWQTQPVAQHPPLHRESAKVHRMSITIRPATSADLPAINEIYNDGGVGTTASYDLEPLTLAQQQQWWNELQEQNYPVFVAAEGSIVAGFAYFSSFKNKAGYRHTIEHTIYVHRDFRGRGVGSLLMTHEIEVAKSSGVHAMVAAVDGRNETSLGFHQRYGFEEVGRMPEVGRKFGQWQTLVYMLLLFPENQPKD